MQHFKDSMAVHISSWPYPGQSPPSATPSAADMYYRQGAAAAALQKPLPYRLYPARGTCIRFTGRVPGPSAQFFLLSASSLLSLLSNYYQNNNGNSNQMRRSSPNPPLKSSSSPGRSESNSLSEDEDTIHV